MQYLVIGHSWVRRLAAYRNLLPNGATILGVGGATFRSAVQNNHPFLVIVVLGGGGGNEISVATT